MQEDGSNGKRKRRKAGIEEETRVKEQEILVDGTTTGCTLSL